MWPTDAEALAAVQEELAHATPEPWRRPDRPLLVAGCWICFPRGLTGRGAAGDPAWGAAVVLRDRALVEQQALAGETGAPYAPGLLALRMGPLVHRTVAALRTRPDVLMLDAGSRDHPRRAGLALHAGAVLDLPTIGVTHRPLLATGDWPADRRGATSPVRIGPDVVGCWLRTRAGTRPLVVHPGWTVDLDTAVELVLEATGHRRTPEPLRRARHLARLTRQEAQPKDPAHPRSPGPVRRRVAPRSS
jgi:deoxyribonuclease V